MRVAILQQRQGASVGAAFGEGRTGHERHLHRPALKHFAVETERSTRDVTVDTAGQFGARDDRRNGRLIAAARRLRGAIDEAVVVGDRQRDRSGGAVGRRCPRTLTCRQGRGHGDQQGGERGPTSGANGSRHGGPHQRFSRL